MQKVTEGEATKKASLSGAQGHYLKHRLAKIYPRCACSFFSPFLPLSLFPPLCSSTILIEFHINFGRKSANHIFPLLSKGEAIGLKAQDTCGVKEYLV